jgi:acetyl esterase/lipase
MIHKQINFTPDERVNMQTYIHEDYPTPSFAPARGVRKRPAVIVMPGGAYYSLAPSEGEPAALTFFQEGFNTFLLNYSVGDDSQFPNPLEDISKAIWEVRKNAGEWGIHPDAVAVMGFSAGAGVANMAATQWNTPGLAERLGIPEGGNKPNAAIIGYGASDMSASTKEVPGKEVPGKTPPPRLAVGKIITDLTPELNAVKYVGPHVPPYFIWHTREDAIVTSDQPLIMAAKLQELGLPYELHVFQFGPHGLSVYNELSAYDSPDRTVRRNRNAGVWAPMCANWLRELWNGVL